MAMNRLENLNFTNSFTHLPEAFYSRLQPTPLQDPHLVSANAQAASLIDLDPAQLQRPAFVLSLIHISEPTRQVLVSRMPSSA